MKTSYIQRATMRKKYVETFDRLVMNSTIKIHGYGLYNLMQSDYFTGNHDTNELKTESRLKHRRGMHKIL